MPRVLPSTDFRAKRVVLTRADFAYAPKPEPLPSDLISKGTWQSIVTLPDDVAVRTSNHHGTALAQLNDLWGAWVEYFGADHDYMSTVMLDAGDDLQAATYTALTGFYRLSVAALRSSLELVAAGAWAQVCNRHQEFADWRATKIELPFGRTCDDLQRVASPLQAHLRATINDTLFDRRTPTTEGGFARRIYSGISNFSHSRPGYADGDMRSSNGPIYVRSAFNHVAWLHFEALGLCFVLLLLARPTMILPAAVRELFGDVERVKSKVTRAAFQFLSETRG